MSYKSWARPPLGNCWTPAVLHLPPCSTTDCLSSFPAPPSQPSFTRVRSSILHASLPTTSSCFAPTTPLPWGSPVPGLPLQPAPPVLTTSPPHSSPAFPDGHVHLVVQPAPQTSHVLNQICQFSCLIFPSFLVNGTIILSITKVKTAESSLPPLPHSS